MSSEQSPPTTNPSPRAFRATILAIMLLLAAVFIGVPLASAQPDKDSASDSNVTTMAERKLLRDGAGHYPRALRLEHNGDANGRIVAGVVSFVGNGDGIGAIYESTDDGESFTEVSNVADAAGADGQGLCCATLFELPQQVGDMPAGTLLWAGTFGADEPDPKMEIRIWRSNDVGRSWEYLSTSAASPDNSPVWEPELSVSADGSLICHYSDESDPDHSQKLMHTRSRDGVNWTDHSPTVTSQNAEERPGMAIVRRLPDDTYFMAFEICATKGQYFCAVQFKTSTDGWNWGDPTNLGVRAETEDGKYFTHTPNISVASNPDSPTGSTIFLIGQILLNADGSVAADNGNAVFTSTSNGTQAWKAMPAPVPVANPTDQPCANFSPTVLPSTDGKELFGIATDKDNDVCKPFYGTVPT